MNNLKLTLQIVEINDVKFGQETKVENHVLYVNKESLLEYINDPVFIKLDVELARPDESVLIVPVKDVIEPRVKMTADGGYFPGILGGFEGYGEGVTKVFRGSAVVTTGQIVGFQEGIIAMDGPAAKFNHFSELNNVVIVSSVKEGITPAKHEEAVRIAGIKAAYFIAKAAKDAETDGEERYELTKVDDSLPRVAVVNMLMAQGLIHDNYLYGVDMKRLHTTFMNPNEFFDGAVVNGTCVVAGDKITTYDYQNNKLFEELYKRHGEDLNFLGVISTPTYPTLMDKQRCCKAAVNIARSIYADGLIIVEEGAGNPDADTMMICRLAEKSGIKTVLVMGADGAEEPFSDVTPEADAVIEKGDCYEKVYLPISEKVIGELEAVKVLSGCTVDSIRDDGLIEAGVLSITGSVVGLNSKLSSTVY